MSNLNKTDGAILQARHLYNDAKVVAVISGGGYTMGSDEVLVRANRMVWGLFEQTILNAMKDRKDLRERNPELVAGDLPCPKCAGAGKFPFTPGTPEYDEQFEGFFSGEEEEAFLAMKAKGKTLRDMPAYGIEIYRHCSPCQGTGIVLKKLPPADPVKECDFGERYLGRREGLLEAVRCLKVVKWDSLKKNSEELYLALCKAISMIEKENFPAFQDEEGKNLACQTDQSTLQTTQKPAELPPSCTAS